MSPLVITLMLVKRSRVRASAKTVLDESRKRVIPSEMWREAMSAMICFFIAFWFSRKARGSSLVLPSTRIAPPRVRPDELALLQLAQVAADSGAAGKDGGAQLLDGDHPAPFAHIVEDLLLAFVGEHRISSFCRS